MLALLLAACSRAPEPYPLEFLEQPAERGAPLPMVVAIHGNNGNPERMMAMVASCGLKARLVAPRAPREGKEIGFSWFDIRLPSRPSWDVATAARMADTIAALLGRLVADRPTLGRPVVTGFSQGGILAYALVARHPHVVGAAVPVSGTFAEEMWPADRPSAHPPPVVRAIQPELDPMVPPGLADGVARGFAERGVDATLEVLPGVAHGFGEDVRPRWCETLRGVLP